MTGIGLGLDELPRLGAAAVCMGVFDGVHRGHRALIEATRLAARERGARSVALVFDPHPQEVIRPGTTMPRLATAARNLQLLEEAGIDHALAIRFDAALRALAPEDFLEAMRPAIELRALVMTGESAFGRARAGTPEAMRDHGRAAGFELVLVEEIVLDGAEPISSGRIRASVDEGRITEATRMLGHAPTVEVTLAAWPAAGDRGPHRLAVDYPAVLPPAGRYPVELLPSEGQRAAELVVAPDDQLHLLDLVDQRHASEPMVVAITGEREMQMG